MKPLNNYKKIIGDAIQGDWQLIAKRKNIPQLPVWMKFIPFNGLLARKNYGTIIPTLCTWEDGFASFYFRSKEYQQSSEVITRLFYNHKKLKVHVKRLQTACEKAKHEAKKFYKKDLSKWSTEKLLKTYDSVILNYGNAFVLGYITWCAQVLQKHCQELVSKKAKTLKTLNIDEQTALGVLISSSKETLYSKKEK